VSRCSDHTFRQELLTGRPGGLICEDATASLLRLSRLEDLRVLPVADQRLQRVA